MKDSEGKKISATQMKLMTARAINQGQGLHQPLPAGYTPEVKLVNVADLPGALPPATPLASAADHAAQIDGRQAQVRMRFAGIPPNLVPFDLNTFEPLP